MSRKFGEKKYEHWGSVKIIWFLLKKCNLRCNEWLLFCIFDGDPILLEQKLHYFFHSLHKTRSYSLKEHEAIFLKRQNLLFSRSIWKYLTCFLF